MNICSYAGGGNQAFPGSAKICEDLGITKDTFYKHFKQIEDAGYITRMQCIGENNKFANNIYEFNFIITRSENSNNICHF